MCAWTRTPFSTFVKVTVPSTFCPLVGCITAIALVIPPPSAAAFSCGWE